MPALYYDGRAEVYVREEDDFNNVAGLYNSYTWGQETSGGGFGCGTMVPPGYGDTW